MFYLKLEFHGNPWAEFSTGGNRNPVARRINKLLRSSSDGFDATARRLVVQPDLLRRAQSTSGGLPPRHGCSKTEVVRRSEVVPFFFLFMFGPPGGPERSRQLFRRYRNKP